MTVISGKDAYVDGVPCTTSWSVAHSAAIQRYACSATQGGTGVVEGNINWSGSMAGLGPNPPVKPGSEFTFKGIVDATNGDTLAIEGTVLIENVRIQFPVRGGGPITWNSTFGAQGLLTSTTPLTGVVDPTSKLAISAKDTGITIDPGGTPYVVPDVQSISLNLSARSATYISSGATERKPGNLIADLSFTLLNRDLFIANYQPNQREIVHIVLNDATFWLIDEVVFGNLSNFQVNVATRSIVGYTVGGMWSAVDDLANNATGNKLVSPDGTVFFAIPVPP